MHAGTLCGGGAHPVVSCENSYKKETCSSLLKIRRLPEIAEDEYMVTIDTLWHML